MDTKLSVASKGLDGIKEKLEVCIIEFEELLLD